MELRSVGCYEFAPLQSHAAELRGTGRGEGRDSLQQFSQRLGERRVVKLIA